jgi:hypothetical protein
VRLSSRMIEHVSGRRRTYQGVKMTSGERGGATESEPVDPELVQG